MNTDYIFRIIINHKPLGACILHIYIYIYIISDTDSAVEAIIEACIVGGNSKEEKQT